MSPEEHSEGLPLLISGSLDYVSESSVEGWAFDPASPERKVQVTVIVNERDVWTGLADQLRPDLVEAGIGDGLHAFYADISNEDLGTGYAEIRAVVTSTGHNLSQSPALLEVTQVAPRNIPVKPPVVLAPTKDVAAEAQPPPPPAHPFIASLDSITEFRVSGWAFNPSAPDIPVSIDLFLGSILLHRATAQTYREDMAQAGIGRGFCSFSFPTPIALLDGRSHRVRAVATNTNFELPCSPMTVTLSSAVPAQILTQLKSVTQQWADTLKSIEQLMDDGSSSRVVKHQSIASTYQLWNARFSSITAEDRAKMLAEIITMQRKPLLTIVMPTYKTPKKFLEAAIQSVMEQIYPYWELCIADDASGEPTKSLLTALAAGDDRIKVKFRPKNGHISEATNTALGMAKGDYICFMDHDDLLTPDALFQVAREINRTNPDIIYSDEDKIDGRNVAVEPHFKPDFNYTLLLSYNYICHLLVIRTAVVQKAGKFKTQYNGSQDHEYLLRCCEIVDRRKIAHIPLILYHWRAHEDSTATSIGTKNYALEAGVKAIEDHLARTGKAGTVSIGKGNAYRVSWALPPVLPKVSVIIPTRDGAGILAVCLLGLLTKTEYSNIEIIVVDNGSEEKETFDLFAQMKAYPNVRILRYDVPFNYSRICNYGAREATGELLLMLNNDIEVLQEHWLAEMVGQVLQPDVGAVGARLLYPDGRIQHAGVILGIGGVAGHAHKFLDPEEYGYMNRINVVHDLSACTAACLLIRRELFEAVGGFNEEHLGVAFNDVDLCLKLLSAGHRIVYTPFATLRHHESVSRGAENTPAKIFRSRREVSYMVSTWSHLLDRDPYYSCNLTLEHEDFRIDLARGASRVTLAVY